MKALRILAAVFGVAAMSAPLGALAQSAPPPAPPSYARPPVNGEETIHGLISSFDGKYRVQLHDDRGFLDNVELHQGTVINPTGLALQPGMTLTILGYNRGPVFAANEIDTPYFSYGRFPRYPAYTVGVGIGPVYFNHWR